MLRWGFNLFPPFLGTGARVTYVADDYLEVRVKLPLTWRTRNYRGTMFGGSMYAATDPIYAFMFLNILGKGYEVWDKTGTIRYKKPVRSALYASFAVTEEEVASIKAELARCTSVERSYEVNLVDEVGRVYARISRTLYIAQGRGRGG